MIVMREIVPAPNPFDRILLGHAVEEGFALATNDSQLLGYGVATVWD
jgi:PIN domain nuclease of toxin-antitoxin system